MPSRQDDNYRSMSLSMAHAVQQALLPKECPKCTGANLAAKYRPVDHIGGDFYDFAHLGNFLVAQTRFLVCFLQRAAPHPYVQTILIAPAHLGLEHSSLVGRGSQESIF